MRCAWLVMSLVVAVPRARADGTPCQAIRPARSPPTLFSDRCEVDAGLARAHALEAALDYAGALATVEQLLARGVAGPVAFVELHALAGKLAAGLDRPAIAEAHFARALAIDPGLALPAGTSPKITGPFDDARARTVPLQVTVRRDGVRLVLDVERDPLGLVYGIEALVQDHDAFSSATDRSSHQLAIPRDLQPRQIAALDISGNAVWLGAPPPLPISATRADRERGVVARWSTWTIVSALALGTGGVAAWRFNVAQHDWDQQHRAMADFTELQAIEKRGRRWGLTANVAFGVGAATGIIAFVLYLRQRDGEPHLIAGPGVGAGVEASF